MYIEKIKNQHPNFETLYSFILKFTAVFVV